VPQTEPDALPPNGTDLLPSPTLGARIDFVKAFLRRRYLIILICGILSAPIAALYLFVTPPTYTAAATLLIESQSNALQQSIFGGDMRFDGSWIESQMGVLRSQNVATYVVKQLRLVDDPRLARPDLDIIDKVMIRLGLKPPPPKTETERNIQAVSAVMKALDIRRVGQSYMMAISVNWPNQDQAIKIANTIIDAYLFDQLNAKYQANRRAGDWLQDRLQTLREQTATAERAVIEFKAKNNIMSTTEGKLLTDKQFTDLNAALAAARSHVADVTLRLGKLDAVREAYQEDQPPRLVADETIKEVTDNGIINTYRVRYLDLINREADWSVRYGKNHIAVVNLRNQIRDIRKSVRDEIGRIEETAKSELEIAKKHQEELEKELAAVMSQSNQTNQAQVALFSLEAQAQSYRKLYDSFLQRHTETVQQQSFPISDARSVSQANQALQTAPNALRVWIMTLFAGCMFGVGFAVLREIMDRGFRTREQVRSILDTECLAMVPLLSDRRARGAFPGRQALAALPMVRRFASRSASSAPHFLRSILDSPSSPYAEAIRALKVTVDLNSVGKCTKVIGLTSCLANEGKSSVAVAMAALIAQSGARVILVDCDLRNPSLSRMLVPEASVGFTDVVSGRTALGDAVWADPATNMAFLPAVANRDLPHGTEVLASEAAKTFFSTLQARYDYVVVDLAPLVAVVDVCAASRLVDGYVLVIEWGATKIDVVQYALRHAPSVHRNIVGAVLNKVDLVSLGRYDGYDAHYYYGRAPQTGATH
jgi:succinoglycan biosynthesis transport protein ExoP